jgi:Spy/CpxP family protein refolding chaperone
MSAWPHEHGHHGWQNMTEQDAAAMKARVIEKVGKRLDLDAAQKAKLGIAADRLREQQLALTGAGADPRADMQGLIAGPNFDRAKAQELIQAKVSAVTVKSPAVVTALADFYDSLKPEQQAKVREFLARRGARHHQG